MPSLLDIPRANIDMPDYLADLPDGWSYGAHWSQPGASGYVLVQVDGIAARVAERPDISWADDFNAGEDEVEADEVSVAMVIAAVVRAAGHVPVKVIETANFANQHGTLFTYHHVSHRGRRGWVSNTDLHLFDIQTDGSPTELLDEAVLGERTTGRIIHGAHLGDVLQQARGGRTLEECAELAGKGRSALHNAESGKTGPRAAARWLAAMLPGATWVCVEGDGWAAAMHDAEARRLIKEAPPSR